MSTEFRLELNDEWICTRWCGPDTVAGQSQNFDWGSRQRLASWQAVAQEAPNVVVVGDDGSRCTLRSFIFDGNTDGDPYRRHPRPVPTFGDFVGTVELGSGEMLDRQGLE